MLRVPRELPAPLVQDALTGLKQEVDKLHRQVRAPRCRASTPAVTRCCPRRMRKSASRRWSSNESTKARRITSKSNSKARPATSRKPESGWSRQRSAAPPPPPPSPLHAHPMSLPTAQDFEMLRIRLIEELEVPYQNRFQQLHQELELSREQFYAQRRETALLREEYENAAAIHIKDMEGQRDEYEMRCDDLRNRVRSMQAMIEDTNQQDQNASLQRESAELKANIKSVRPGLIATKGPTNTVLWIASR